MSLAAPIQVGTVPYLNARPLTEGLAGQPGVILREATPARLVTELRAGRLDVAVVSSIELFRRPDYGVIPGIGVASEDKVESVLLFHRRQLTDGCTISLDTSSRTGEALVRIACETLLGLDGPSYRHDPPATDPREIAADAVLRIGDPALRQAHETAGEMEAIDLGSLWRRMTGRPFVYALWVVSPRASLRTHERLFYEALDRGLADRRRIASRAARTLPLGEKRILDYLTHTIHYRLGPAHLEGLRLFGRLAAELGLADPTSPRALAADQGWVGAAR